MNVYVYDIRKFIKQISKYYYIASNKIRIEVGNNYNIYVFCILKTHKKFIVLNFINNKFNKDILLYVKKYLIKKDIYFKNNKDVFILKIYKK